MFHTVTPSAITGPPSVSNEPWTSVFGVDAKRFPWMVGVAGVYSIRWERLRLLSVTDWKNESHPKE